MSNESVSNAIAPNVVIHGSDSASGAEAVAPEAQGRSDPSWTQYVPGPGVVDEPLQRQVEDFLFRQAAYLDAQDWERWIGCFADEGVYWMPAEPQASSWSLEPSIFAEDRWMMRIRMARMRHPNAWSQAPMWGTNHMVGNVVLEEVTDAVVQVYSRFQMMELRRDDVRHFGGTYRHTLSRTGGDLAIALQRVDLMNGQAPYDYVLQAWV